MVMHTTLTERIYTGTGCAEKRTTGTKHSIDGSSESQGQSAIMHLHVHNGTKP